MFVPLLLAHKMSEPSFLLKGLLAFLAFGFCASSAYILNDLLDRNDDRAHPIKKNRPFASGELSPATGIILIPLLLISLLPALGLGRNFVALLGIYYVFTVGYSLFFKGMLFLDVVILAGLYTIRILAGAEAAAVPVSPWLLAFSLFFFFSMALVKRYSELFGIRRGGREENSGRKYLSGDLEPLGAMGIASGYLSILILAFYMNSAEIRALYSRPHLLWLVCPVFLYWISRIWLLAHRGRVPEDPIVFAVKDGLSYAVGAVIGLVMFVAS